MGVLDGFEVVTRGNLEQVALVQVTQFKPQRHGQVSNGVRHLFHSVHGGVCGGGSPPFGRSQVHQRREFRKKAHDCQVWLWHFEQVTLTEIVGRPWMLGGGIAFRKTDGLADGLGEGQVGGGSDAQGHGSNASSYGGKGGENLCGKSVGDLVGDLVGRGHGCTGAHGGGGSSVELQCLPQQHAVSFFHALCWGCCGLAVADHSQLKHPLSMRHSTVILLLSAARAKNIFPFSL